MVLKVIRIVQREVIHSQYLTLRDFWEDLYKFLHHRITLRSKGEL